MRRSRLLALCSLLLSCSSSAVPLERVATRTPPPSRGTPAAPSRDPGRPGEGGGTAPGAPQRPHAAAPSCLNGSQGASPRRLLRQAEAAFDDGSYQRALACAEEALRTNPRHVAALHYRAAALAALDRLEEARAAYDRALAVHPNDPETLHGAADLLVGRLGDRASLELGLERALRGARLAQAPAHRDRDLAGRLFLLAGMAENDLGRSGEALAHLRLAFAGRPGDPDVVYERGVALYELCRFTEARRSFETVLRRVPDDPWALHYLGLVAERIGDERRARSLLSRAVTLAPGKIPPEVDLDHGAFEAEVRRTVATLPDGERRALATVPLQIEDLPALADLTAVDPPLSPSILGLFRGPPEGESCAPGEGDPCRSIVLYRRNLARFARDRRDLTEQIRVTLLHELGHLHGRTDDELRKSGLE